MSVRDHVGVFVKRLVRPGFVSPSELIEAGVDPTYVFDFSTPPVQARPTTAASLAGLIGNVTAGDVDEIFILEGTGSVVGQLGNYSLNEVNTPLRNQTALCFNGTDWTTRKAAEVRKGTFNGFVCTSTAMADLGTANNVAVLTKVRYGEPPSATGVLWEKRNSGFGAGYELRVTTTGLVLLAEDALGDITSSVTLAANTKLFDGAWHYVLCVFDFTNNRMTIYLDFTSVSATSVLNTGQSFASTNAFRVMTGWNRQSNDCQVDYVAVMSGASVADIDGAGSFWTLGSDVTGALTTATHGSLLSDVVANDASLGELVNHWHGGSGHGIDQIPYGYHAANTQGPNALGCWLASTNMYSDSEDFTTAFWLVVGVTRTKNAVNSPDGFQHACLCDGSGATSYLQSQNLTVSNDTVYTFSCWLKLKDSASGTIRFRWQNSLVQGDNQDNAVTNKWKRYTFTFTTKSTGTGALVRIYTGDGVSALEDYYIWGAQFVAGSDPGRYGRALGSTATVAKTVYEATGVVHPEKGEIQTHVIATDLVTAAVKQVWDTVGNPDRRRAALLSNNKFYVEMRNAVGTSFFAPTSGTAVPTVNTEHLHVVQWQDLSERLLVDGTPELTDSDNYSFGGADRDLNIGQDNTDTGQLNGYISKLTVYDQVVTE